jgi:uncharacterized protein YidB (DUF937 family)
MGLFDDAVPGGNISKPILIALGALLVSRMFANRDAQVPEGAGAPMPGNDAAPADGGLLGGLGGLLDKLRNAGQGEAADSWVRPGPNQSIEPGQLGSAIGQQTISDLARQAGISEQELLQQLSKILPGMVDKLTPDGRLPNQQQVATLFARQI